MKALRGYVAGAFIGIVFTLTVVMVVESYL